MNRQFAPEPAKDATSAASLRRRTSEQGGPGPVRVPAVVHDVLHAPGQALDAGARTFFEPRFGHDFGRVRVHSDPRAAASARALGADAYTHGFHVVFAAGRYGVNTDAGRQLLGHELAHVVRGGDAPPPRPGEVVRLSGSSDGDERTAEQMAQRATALGDAELPAGANTIVRIRSGPRKNEESESGKPPAPGTPRDVAAGTHSVIWRREAVLPPDPVEENPAERMVEDEVPGLTRPAINGLTIMTGEHLVSVVPEPQFQGRPIAGGRFECRVSNPVDIISGTDMIVTTPPGAQGWRADASPAWLADYGETLCMIQRRPVPLLLRHESDNRTFYSVVRRSEGEHHADVADLHRTILKPYHDRLAAAAAAPRTGATAQECAVAIANHLDWSNTLVNYINGWQAATARHDGPGGTHTTDATLTTSEVCMDATLTVRGS